MPLRILVIGAGIAGLSTALALAHAGHAVTVAEKSAFAAEVGAALVLAPNGARVLDALGFAWARARAVELPLWETVDGRGLGAIAAVDMAAAREAYGGRPMRAVHRVDLHAELLRLAALVAGDRAGGGGGDGDGDRVGSVEIRLASPVVRVGRVEGRVWLEDGTVIDADLVVGADGVHSLARREVVDEVRCSGSGLNAFRFLVPTERMDADPSLRGLKEWKKPGATIFVDTKDRASQRHVVWYDCQGGQVQNLVGLHPPRSDMHEGCDFRALLLDEFKDFHPDLMKLLRLADHVKCWPLSYYEPFGKWYSEKVVLVGDAAHPMLPLSGQAANQALEDAGALGCLFRGVQTAAEIPARLAMFDTVRRKRASMIQILSSTLVGREDEVKDKLLAFSEDGQPSKFQLQ